ISDATRDADSNFNDFLKAYRRYRSRGQGMPFCRLERWSDLDKELPLQLQKLRPRKLHEQNTAKSSAARGSSRRRRLRYSQRQMTVKAGPGVSQRHFILSRLVYPEDRDGRKNDAVDVYLKSTMTGDEPVDLKQYQIDNPLFPHDPTTDQFFTENQVESYRQLGYHIGIELCETVLTGISLNQQN